MLTFPAGQTRAEFTVDITDDNLIEAMESFQLLLSIAEDLISKGVQVGPNSAATVTIMDNDGELYSTIYVNVPDTGTFNISILLILVLTLGSFMSLHRYNIKVSCNLFLFSMPLCSASQVQSVFDGYH